MALASRDRQPTAPIHGTPCSIGEIYRLVADDTAELAELNAILYEEGNTQAEVYKYLTEDGGFGVINGRPLGFQTINKHRGKNCRCFRHAPFRFCDECKRDKPSCVCDNAR